MTVTTTNVSLPNLGYGLGLRPAHYSVILEEKPSVDWFEVISENFMDTGGKPVRILAEVLEHYPVILHGVSLSIGTIDPLNSEYLQKLKKLADWVNPPWLSDHLCWTGIAHKNTHDLLPVPYTEQALKHIVQRIREVQDFLERPVAFENPSTYLEFRSSHMSEWEFLARMAEESGCHLLLDANNIYVSCYNHKWDPQTYIDALPLDRVAQIHLAGHTNKGTHIIDTHDDHVIDEVWSLYNYIIGKRGPVSTMIEWDDKIPEFPVMLEERDRARQWAKAAAGPVEMPRFEALRSNIRPPETPPEYSRELNDLQAAILRADPEKMNPDERIVPKPDFAPADQVRVYIKGYRLRLFDNVYPDYEALRHYLGRKAFNQLVDDFIEATPSGHFNILRYVEAFPRFVKEHCDEFAYELAVFETAISRLADAEETPPLTQAHLTAITPESLPELKLKPRKALRIMACSWSVNDYYNEVVMEGRETGPCLNKLSFIAIYRHEDGMRRLALEEEEYMVLASLFSGQPVGQALAAAGNDNLDPGTVQRWFSRWINNGLLAA